MAQLDVQPKKSNLWWLWLLLAIAAVVILFFLLKGSGHNDNGPNSTKVSIQSLGETNPVAGNATFAGRQRN